MDDIATIRFKNLASLVEQHGGPTAFGERIGRQQAQVSQWTSAKKPKQVGDKLAREIEDSLGIERGWMDHPQGGGQAISAPTSLLDPELVRDTLRVLDKMQPKGSPPFDIRANPAWFVLAYELRAGMTAEPSQSEEDLLGSKLAQIPGTGKNASDERRDGVPTEGAHQGKTA